jgi:hypothetical protein
MAVQRFLAPLVGAALAVTLIAAAPAAMSKGHDVLEFSTMAPVIGPFVGSANPIRGINGGGLPWQLDSARGELSSSGHLEVTVKGLVLLNGDPVPVQLRGTNPAATFVGIVSCQTTVAGAPAVANVATSPFPATSTGDSQIEANVTLPSPCFAPIVFVGPSAATWFAVTGQ